MYARTSFRGANVQNWKKEGVFGHIDKFEKDMTRQIKKNACKNMYLGSFFILEKYVLRVCFESPFTRMISNMKYKCPPPKKICPVLSMTLQECSSILYNLVIALLNAGNHIIPANSNHNQIKYCCKG